MIDDSTAAETNVLSQGVEGECIETVTVGELERPGDDAVLFRGSDAVSSLISLVAGTRRAAMMPAPRRMTAAMTAVACMARVNASRAWTISSACAGSLGSMAPARVARDCSAASATRCGRLEGAGPSSSR